MQTTRDRLTAALDLMETKGWTKFTFKNDSGYCVRGALGETSIWNDSDRAPIECYEKIDAALVELGYASRKSGGDPHYVYSIPDDKLRNQIAFFNNHGDTTFDDMRRVMRRAIELA